VDLLRAFSYVELDPGRAPKAGTSRSGYAWWIAVTAAALVDCTRCGALAGDPCTGARGRVVPVQEARLGRAVASTGAELARAAERVAGMYAARGPRPGPVGAWEQRALARLVGCSRCGAGRCEPCTLLGGDAIVAEHRARTRAIELHNARRRA
jgi:hypothetical protein